MARSVLLEGVKDSGEVSPLGLDLAVAAVATAVGLGFVATPQTAFIRAGTDAPPGVVRPDRLYVSGTITADVPDSGMVVGGGWTIRIFHDSAIAAPTYSHPTILGAPLHTGADVAAVLNVPAFTAKHARGEGVAIGIVDGGINLAHLRTVLGWAPAFNSALSSLHPNVSAKTPGAAGVGHGTMCAYDALIAARQSTLLDLACLTVMTEKGPGALGGLISQVLYVYAAFEKNLPAAMAAYRGLVLSNSWAVWDALGDFPLGHPSSYIANPGHPFNQVVGDLERWGVDMVFSAGNCRTGSGNANCRGDGGPGAIYGANSHPAVLTVTAVNVNGAPLASSSEGPGRLHARKPDIAGFSNFVGSELAGPFFLDSYTSAACAVVAGVVGCIRSVRPSTYTTLPSSWTPDYVRKIVRSTGASMPFNVYQGHGTIDGTLIASQL